MNLIDLYKQIWDEREHVSELSGKPLLPINNYQWHWQFLHVLPKGSYPKWKFNKKNIILALPEEHERQNEYEIFNQRYEQLRQEYYKTFYNKSYE